ncbi:Uncharacterised protein [Mycobacteroides abscessus subsp. abscessus]|nr:Uncharacterised protein [Mycobacteroides abscessus subsp. abscessus]
MRLRTPERRRSRALRLIANHAAARSLGSLRASAMASAAAIASATPELRLRPPSGANWWAASPASSTRRLTSV